MGWEIIFTKQAQKDSELIKRNGLKPKVEHLLQVLQNDPFAEHPRYEKLIGDLQGIYSRRINLQHRLTYEIYEQEKIVRIIRMWSHYE